ncbi:hypothetical protein D3C77_791610 [compost metagenome]
MSGALNEAAAVVEKPVRLPFQWNAAVRAAVFVGVQPPCAAHHQQVQPSVREASALAFRQFMAGT